MLYGLQKRKLTSEFVEFLWKTYHDNARNNINNNNNNNNNSSSSNNNNYEYRVRALRHKSFLIQLLLITIYFAQVIS